VPDMPAFSGVALPDASPEALKSAVAAVLGARAEAVSLPDELRQRLPSVERLRASAEEGSDARFFLAALEMGYLVAAADGVDAREQAALGELISRVTGLALDPATLAGHFRAFDEAARSTSRTARVESITERLRDFVEREEALGFAALVAMADHHFARKEARALIELGEALGFTVGEVQVLLDSLVEAIRQALSR
jgi:tellurite resistance protein